MSYLVICAVALAASALTFFSGFGLGTLLLPAFALFFPVEVAVAMTAVVHFLNGLFKLALVGGKADVSTAVRFGVPAVLSAFAGASLLAWLTDLSPLYAYQLASRRVSVTPINLVVAALMVLFAALELWPRFKGFTVPAKYLPLGGVLTGFFGGLSGHQGAFRSVFLLRAGLTKEAFIATGVVIATAVDVSRLSVYWTRILSLRLDANAQVILAATLSAFVGALLGNRLLKKVTMRTIEVTVAVILFAVAAGLASGLL